MWVRPRPLDSIGDHVTSESGSISAEMVASICTPDSVNNLDLLISDGGEEGKESSMNSSEELAWWAAFQDDLFEVPRKRTKLTRQQKRDVRKQFSAVKTRDSHFLDLTTEEFSELQQTDPTSFCRAIFSIENGVHLVRRPL